VHRRGGLGLAAGLQAGVGLRRQHEPGGDQAVQTMVIDTLRWANIGLFPVNDRSMVNSEARFGSAHANGFHLLLCDGAVRLASYAIGPYVFEHLGNRSDGDVVSDWRACLKAQRARWLLGNHQFAPPE
jgi:hypothetical protein